MSRPVALIRAATQRLAAAGVASPESDATLLLAHVLGRSRGELVLVDQVPAEAIVRFEELLDRRVDRVPVQHLTGTAAFRHLELAVGPGVFVPRPETELLAGWAIEQAAALAASPGSTGRPVRVVDLCTGSGAIAAALAQEVPTAEVYAVERDPGAHEWALRNLAGTGVRLEWGDLADALPDLDGTVDVVVCNPPYIPLEAWESVEPEARDHDPHLALFSGDDGLDAIRVLAVRAAGLLRVGGVLGFEHADVQGESAPAVLTDPGSAAGVWTDVRDHRDLAGRARFCTARLAR